MDDLLDLVESNDEPFAEDKKEVGTEKKEDPKPRYTGNNSKIDYYEDVNIEPHEVDSSKLQSVGKFFNIATYVGDDGMPPEIIDKMYNISKALMDKGFFMRYNGDKASFYNKILDIDLSRVEMYIPWKKYNTNFTPKMSKPSNESYHNAAYYHKGYKKIGPGGRAMTAITVHTILGESLTNPVKLMICYSSDGAESIKDIDFKTTGFISFPITVCDKLGIPVFNLANDDAVSRLVEYVKSL